MRTMLNGLVELIGAGKWLPRREERVDLTPSVSAASEEELR